MKLRYKMILLLIMAAFVPLLAVFISISVYADRQRESLGDLQLDRVYGGAVSSYERMGKSILGQIEQLTGDQTLWRYLLVKDETGYIDQQGLIDMTVDMKRLLNLDYLMILSPDGVVLSRGHDPAFFGDNLSSESLFAEALSGQKVQSLNKTDIRGEAALTVMALAPIWYDNREMIGLVAGGNFLDEDFCFNLRDLSGAEIMLVEGNALLAKTIPGNPGEMTLYLPSEDAAGREQQNFRTKLQGRWFTFSRYPLKDFSGNKVADLLMGVSTQDLDILFNNMRVIYGGFALGGLILAIVLGYLSSWGFTRPIENLTRAADRLASGDFSARVQGNGRGELTNLIDTFNEMAADLEDYRRRLVETERLAAFSTMARKVAHEIKNPLTPIKIAVEDLRRAYGAGDPRFAEALDQSTRTVLEEVNSLTKIVEEFSDFAKFPPPCFKDDDLNEIVRSTLALFSSQMQQKALKIELEPRRLPVNADRDQIKRALVNLIKNALEAIPPTGEVRVKTLRAERGAKVLIMDNGPGLAPSVKQNLFTPYFTTKAGGTGLGLVIVKKIISEHNGKIKLSDQPGGGVAAMMELPLRG
jgi:signal transduction histidine kinase